MDSYATNLAQSTINTSHRGIAGNRNRPVRAPRRRIGTLMMALLAFVALSMTAAAGPIITIELGRPRLDCRGFGICRITAGANSGTDNPSAVQAEATLAGDQLTFAFAQMSSNRADSLVIDDPVQIAPELARSLGAASLVIRPGTYAVDYAANPNGTVTVGAQRVGITIDIQIGRRSKGCTGFGICSITIGADAASSAARAGAVLRGDDLTIQLLEPMHEAGGVLVIDEDIILEKRVTDALGSEPRKVKRGEYTVDYSNNPNGTVHVATERLTITINVEIGRRSKGCSGFGICRVWVEVDLSETAVMAAVSGDGAEITLDMLEPMREHGDALVIDEDIVLDEATSRTLGSRRVTIPHGTYTVDYSRNVNGTVHLPVQRFGFTVEVIIGRPAFHCTGLGICSIKIGLGADASERGVPAIATLDGGKLLLEFASTLPEQGDALAIDEDLTLDPAVARDLGFKSVTIRKGAYTLRHDAQGNTSVELDVQTQGITINIRFGRRIRNCRGFGICSIVIGADDANTQSELRVPTIGVVEKGGLTLDLSALVPERDSVLVIDEPVVLDSAVAAAFGLESGAITPGAYPVDFSASEFGTVRVPIQSASVAGVAGPAIARSAGSAATSPNPTSGHTTLAFNLRRSGPVTIELVNASGRRVLGLADDAMMSEGDHSVSFDASGLAGGVYFYTIRSASGMQTGSMIVTR